jgi:hypothetical protein
MCTVLLPSGVNPIAVKYIIIKDVKLDFTGTGLELRQGKCRCQLKIAMNLLENAEHLADCRGE